MKGAKEFKPPGEPTSKQLETINGVELMVKDLPKTPDVVDGIIPRGLTVFAGKPKMGKSWLILATALAIANDGYALGKIKVQAGEALYLGLEDSERRLQDRLKVFGEEIPKTLHLGISLPRMDEGGLDFLSSWLEQHSDARLVVIDTLARVRPRRVKGGDIYEEDASVGSELQALALHHNIALVMVHHLRKAMADDPLDAVSGSTGLTGAADAVLVLMRPRGQKDAVLHITGRDIEEKALALRFSPAEGAWLLVGEAEKSEMTHEEMSDLEEAKAWLESQLAESTLPAKTLFAYAKKEGISERTLKRAKQALSVLSKRESAGNKGGGAWVWQLARHTIENNGTLAPVAESIDRDNTPATITTVPDTNVGTLASTDNARVPDTATMPTDSATVPTDKDTGTVAQIPTLSEENKNKSARSATVPKVNSDGVNS